MTNSISAAQISAGLREPSWAVRLGAFRLPSVSEFGTSVPAAGPFTLGSPALPRVRGKVAVMVPQAQQAGQTNIHNYMTGVAAAGGASDPPREKEPV